MRRAGWGTPVAASMLLCACGSGPSGQASVGGFGPSGSVVLPTPSSVFESTGPVDPLTAAGLQAVLVSHTKAQLPPRTAVAATCPAIPASPHASVHCTVTIAGTAVDWLVTSLGENLVDAAPAVGVIRLSDARSAVASAFNDYANPTVDCGAGVVAVVKVDDEIECTIASGSRERTAHVIVTDQFGHFQVAP